jgi:hypothetical protein
MGAMVVVDHSHGTGLAAVRKATRQHGIIPATHSQSQGIGSRVPAGGNREQPEDSPEEENELM